MPQPHNSLLVLQNLTFLYQQLLERIDLYVAASLHRAEQSAARQLSKNILRQMRIEQMKNLRHYIYTHQQDLHIKYHHPTEINPSEQEFGEGFVAVYNELLRMQRNIPKLNTHKATECQHRGKFASCVYDLLQAMEVELAAYQEGNDHHNNFIPDKFVSLLARLDNSEI